MKILFPISTLNNWIKLLRWDKPSGRLILLIPAFWSLWLAPSSPPPTKLMLLIVFGGVSISGAGCIANDLWDRNIDKKVDRTKYRPLAIESVKISTAWGLLLSTLLISLIVILLLPNPHRALCLQLASIALITILIYPSSKRWFKYPQLLLAICWGFAVLISWVASESSLEGGITLYSCWLATMLWTFGFDTIYAMADKSDDKKLGLNSSAINLGVNAIKAVSIAYFLASLLIGISAFYSPINWPFWPIWFLTSFGMQREVFLLKNPKSTQRQFQVHFKRQVSLGSLLLFGLILGKL